MAASALATSDDSASWPAGAFSWIAGLSGTLDDSCANIGTLQSTTKIRKRLTNYLIPSVPARAL
jgi:hypothetical protein